MKKEIAAMVFFLKRLIKKAEKLETEQVEKFVERLTVVLQEKYKDHWYPENPSKGQAFRCIRVNKFQREDPELQRACNESGVLYKDLGLPRELTLWVDPGEVCCRYGEKNFAFTVATFSADDEDKEELTKKVANAVERVTSDYHSGSSSDEEGSAREPCPPACFPPVRPLYQQIMYPGVPMWNLPMRKKSRAGRTGPGQGLPRQVYRFRPQGKSNQLSRPSSWTQAACRSGQYWGSTPNLMYC
ncbi:protein BTG3-like isoform X1 [Arapaima gigas]